VKGRITAAKVYVVGFFGGILVLSLVLSSERGKREDASFILENERIGAIREEKQQPLPTSFPHLFDHSPAGRDVLFSKVSSAGNSFQADALSRDDLWLRDGEGRERFIAREVASAKFSPDGSKIAYCTSSNELFIETLNGKRLAQIPRAGEPSWSSDGSSVNFSAIPSMDYPELMHLVVYNIDTGEVAPQPSAGVSPSR
jgi:hypothetical protein